MDSASSTANSGSSAVDDTCLVRRHFTRDETSPLDEINWIRRDAWPDDPKHFMAGVEAPDFWSQQAVDIAAKLYLAKGDEPETSVRHLIGRVSSKITWEGVRAGYFQGSGVAASIFVDGDWHEISHEALRFFDELCYICVHQLATFNSPVWFNIGRSDRPQCPSACFILSVDDNTESIMRWARDEAFIFKSGSGCGVNASNLRGSSESLSTGGIASGPVSFIRVPNAVAETIKSGGTTRRAAKCIQLDVDHPDIEDFIDCKVREEERLRLLAEAGVDISMGAEGERNVAEVTSYQSANHMVRVTDEFMKLALSEPYEALTWPLVPRKSGWSRCVSAHDLLRKMADAAQSCADPGIMFHDTINSWHTTPADGPIRSTNPCGELHTPDNSSCNLASINVLKFIEDRGVDDLRQVIDVMTLAMDILVEFCELPTEVLTRRTKQYRWLGLGCSNMGAALMVSGHPYDSDEGRDLAASFMALITGRCYRQSADIASRMGPFEGFDENREAMNNVIATHGLHLPIEGTKKTPIWVAARDDWTDVRNAGNEGGFRNAQASVIAPAGTTSYFMDCDTTGIEPAFSLVTYKQLAGGGSMTLVNGSVERALRNLGYLVSSSSKIQVLAEHGVESFLSVLDENNRSIFAGANEISVDGHIKMLAAVQPFISGAASKTINMPESATADDIYDAFVMAWRLGVKCIAVYRDGSKARQVLSTKAKSKDESLVPTSWEGVVADPVADIQAAFEGGRQETERMNSNPIRRRLPRTRQSVTHKIHLRSAAGEYEGYITAGMYPDDGSLGEIFLEGFGRLGGFTQNVLAAWATAFSVSLQYGVPLGVLLRKHVGHSDETGGVVVPDPDGGYLAIRSCDSIVDYIARWVAMRFGDNDLREELGIRLVEDEHDEQDVELVKSIIETTSAPLNGHAKSTVLGMPCPSCTRMMYRAGSCWTCRCGYNTGCG